MYILFTSITSLHSAHVGRAVPVRLVIIIAYKFLSHHEVVTFEMVIVMSLGRIAHCYCMPCVVLFAVCVILPVPVVGWLGTWSVWTSSVVLCSI